MTVFDQQRSIFLVAILHSFSPCTRNLAFKTPEIVTGKTVEAKYCSTDSPIAFSQNFLTDKFAYISVDSVSLISKFQTNSYIMLE